MDHSHAGQDVVALAELVVEPTDTRQGVTDRCLVARHNVQRGGEWVLGVCDGAAQGAMFRLIVVTGDLMGVRAHLPWALRALLAGHSGTMSMGSRASSVP